METGWYLYVSQEIPGFSKDHRGEFLPVEVELGRALGGLREITGVEPGSRVVSEGAFFVASQIAKGGFDPHNH